MANSIVGSDSVPLRRDWWPLTRLVLVGIGLYAASRVLPGWGDVGVWLETVAGDILKAAVGVAILSPVAANFYLGVALIPIVLITVLNDWVYDGTACLLKRLCGLREGALLGGLVLSLELAFFLSLVEFLRRVWSATL